VQDSNKAYRPVFKPFHVGGNRNLKQTVKVGAGKVINNKINNKLQYLERKPHQSWLVFMQVLYPGRIGIWRCWFLWRGENRRTRRKTLRARREPTTNLGEGVSGLRIDGSFIDNVRSTFN